MAEPKPAPTTGPSAAAAPTKLKAVSEAQGGPVSGPARPSSDGVSRGLFALVALLLVLAVAGLWAQTRRASAQAERIGALESEVGSLESQLSVAHEQLSAYGTQLGLVQGLAADVYEKMGSLLQIVEGSPFEAAHPSEAITEP
jgi:hypothetical protein